MTILVGFPVRIPDSTVYCLMNVLMEPDCDNAVAWTHDGTDQRQLMMIMLFTRKLN